MAKSKNDQVTLDRRANTTRRAEDDRRKKEVAVAEDNREGQRRKVQRRRQIDPTTCERDYTGHEIEFMQALDQYKRDNGRMFPTCSEILEVIRGLGYVRLTPEEMEEFGLAPAPVGEETEGEFEEDEDMLDQDEA